MISHLEWIKPGAEIVVYQSRDGQASDPVKTTVKTRAKKSFTVEGVEDRFNLDRMETTPRGGGVWSSATRWVALYPGSEYARTLFERDRKRQVVFRAQVAVKTWQKNPNRETRLAAIEALQKIED